MFKYKDHTQEQIEAIRQQFAQGADDTQFTNFLRECETRNLIPGRHVYFQVRRAKEFDKDSGAWIFVKKATHITSIDAFRLIAERTGKYQGQSASYVYLDNEGAPTVMSEIPLPEPNKSVPRVPWAVIVEVHRQNFAVPLRAVARFDAYAVKDKEGKLSGMWYRMAPEMNRKCAEALGLRQAFPEELAGIMIAEELQDELEPEASSQSEQKQPTPPAAEPPAVDHTPAEPTDKPRPGEQTMQQFVESCTPTDQQIAEKQEQAKDAEAMLDDFGTRKERQEYAAKLRKYVQETLPKLGVEGPRDKLLAFVRSVSGKQDTKLLTKQEFVSILSQLEQSEKAGTLKELLK